MAQAGPLKSSLLQDPATLLVRRSGEITAAKGHVEGDEGQCRGALAGSEGQGHRVEVRHPAGAGDELAVEGDQSSAVGQRCELRKLEGTTAARTDGNVPRQVRARRVGPRPRTRAAGPGPGGAVAGADPRLGAADRGPPVRTASAAGTDGPGLAPTTTTDLPLTAGALIGREDDVARLGPVAPAKMRS